jgi:protein-S-isoprenylcysteine O-methyltransferase Ste14
MSTSSLSAGSVTVHHSTRRLLMELAGNVLLSLMFLQFLIVHGRQFLADHRLSTLLLVAKVATDVLFYLIRRVPKEITVSPYDWAVGLMGTFMIAFFRPEAHGNDHLLAQGLQMAGLVLQVAAMLSLNTSIGIAAANRGVKTGGMYRFLRHPLYFSYIVAYGGYLMSHPTSLNMMVYSSAVLLWVLRILAEERLLKKDPCYATYAEKVRWRLVPYVF